VGDPVVRYVPRNDATPEGELDALIFVYRFLLQRHAEKAADEGRLKPEGGVHGALSEESNDELLVIE
jgi:hypothetical protein